MGIPQHWGPCGSFKSAEIVSEWLISGGQQVKLNRGPGGRRYGRCRPRYSRFELKCEDRGHVRSVLPHLYRWLDCQRVHQLISVALALRLRSTISIAEFIPLGFAAATLLAFFLVFWCFGLMISVGRRLERRRERAHLPDNMTTKLPTTPSSP